MIDEIKKDLIKRLKMLEAVFAAGTPDGDAVGRMDGRLLTVFCEEVPIIGVRTIITPEGIESLTVEYREYLDLEEGRYVRATYPADELDELMTEIAKTIENYTERWLTNNTDAVLDWNWLGD